MPSYLTKQVDEQGKPIYQDVCFPVTKEFREKLFSEIVKEYEFAMDKNLNQVRDNVGKQVGSGMNQQEKDASSFR
jgi:DNA-binding cell septation regulator SpoVG